MMDATFYVRTNHITKVVTVKDFEGTVSAVFDGGPAGKYALAKFISGVSADPNGYSIYDEDNAQYLVGALDQLATN